LSRDYDTRTVVSWAMYDWGNSAYATSVMAGFFPVFFKQYWNAGQSVNESTFHLGVANAIASMVIVVLAPLLGAIADKGSARKKFLVFFAAMGVVMTGGLFFVAQGQWIAAMMLYIFATVGFMGGQTSYENFVFTADYGYMIRDGKLAEMVRDVQMMGNVFQTLKDIDMIGDDFEMFENLGGCGKGGQSPLPVSDGGPHIRIQNVIIGGE